MKAASLARPALGAALALEVALILYAVVAALQGVISGNAGIFFEVGSLALSAVTLEFQRRLLRRLFAGEAAPDTERDLLAFRSLYPWVLGLGLFNLAIYALSTGEPTLANKAPNPGATALFLLTWAASLYTSFQVYVGLVRVFREPGSPASRASLSEWLLRYFLAGAVFTLMNVATPDLDPEPWTGLRALSLGLYVAAGLLDLALALLTRRALGTPRAGR